MHCYRSEGFPKHTPWFEFTGMHSTGHGAQLPIEIHFLDTASPITHGLKDWTTIHEELYNNAAGGPLATAHALATGAQGNYKTIVVWTNEYRRKTKVFCTTIGPQHRDDRRSALSRSGHPRFALVDRQVGQRAFENRDRRAAVAPNGSTLAA